MLAIISDLHLSDGTTAANIHESAFQLLGEELKTAAKQKAAKELHLVLLGDVVDLVRTDWWHRQGIPADARPWGGKLDPETAMNVDTSEIERQFLAILDAVLETDPAQGLLRMIGELPRATSLPVRVSYIVGNHDRVLNNFPVLQARLRERWARGVELEFDTKLALPEYGLLCRHGHEWDENCHAWLFMTKVLKRNRTVKRFDPTAYRVMAIGEVITAELMSGLIYYTASQLDLGKAEDRLFLAALKDVNNLRPMTDVLKWIGWMMQGQTKRYVQIAGDALGRALDGLLDSSLARRWDAIQPDLLISGDITDWLDRARRALAQDGLISLTKEVSSLGKIQEKLAAAYALVTGKGERDPYANGAAEDLRSADPSTQFVAYGHTHRAVRQGLATSPKAGARVYLNTGTYLPLIDRTTDGSGFWRAYRIALALLFKDDEDSAGRAGPGPTLDVWDGVRLKQYKDGGQ
jgi:UDP-2,3-diacylglucosamine pyrophosphatase LpxH